MSAAVGLGQRELLMNAVEELSSWFGVKQACEHLAIAKSSVYRRRRRRFSSLPVGALRSSARGPKDEEKSLILACLHEDRFQDCSPAQVYASLLNDGQYHCSIRTIALKCDSYAAMYRLLEKEGENRERRDQVMQFLLPVRRLGRVQPLRHRLDDRLSGDRRPR